MVLVYYGPGFHGPQQYFAVAFFDYSLWRPLENAISESEGLPSLYCGKRMEMLLFSHNVPQNRLGFTIILRGNLPHRSYKTRAFKTNPEGCLFKIPKAIQCFLHLGHTFQFPSVPHCWSHNINEVFQVAFRTEPPCRWKWENEQRIVMFLQLLEMPLLPSGGPRGLPLVPCSLSVRWSFPFLFQPPATPAKGKHSYGLFLVFKCYYMIGAKGLGKVRLVGFLCCKQRWEEEKISLWGGLIRQETALRGVITSRMCC